MFAFAHFFLLYSGKTKKKEGMEREFTVFVRNILGNRKRRLHLVKYWNSVCPILEKTVSAILYKLFTIVLYRKIKLRMTKNEVSFFDGDLGLPYWVFTDEEREFLIKLFCGRKHYFATIVSYEQVNFSLSEFNHNGKDTLPIEMRRELLRDFVYRFIYYQPKLSLYLRGELILMLQHIMINGKRKQHDRFVYELHHVLQDPNKDVKKLIVHYP
jgi:hypothetical protein